MILWTIQDLAIWEQLEEKGRYTASDELIEFPESEDDARNHANYAYRWLANQMAKRIGLPPEGTTYPIWAWYKQQDQADGKPDMRHAEHRTRKACVRMKLSIPDWEVLLSDFDDWHYALNYFYLPLSREDNKVFDAWYESLGIDFEEIGNWKLQSPELTLVRNKVEASWERMLGVRPADDPWGFPWEKRSIQATFWELKREHVISVETFGSRWSRP